MSNIKQSEKLRHVCYEIRGPALQQAKKLEEEGYKILKLNIGNPGAFGFDAPEEILRDVILNLPQSQGYSDSKGLFAARKAIMHETQRLNVKGVAIDDIYLGNGVSELIVLAMQGLLNNGDEVLVPAPDYPLWTAAITLAGGNAVHYVCDEEAEWQPDIADIRKKITKNTKAIVVINPNNPTGAVYSRELLLEIVELARQHNLIIYADEIYDKILYDGAVHVPLASLADDVLVISFNGLSKNYRLAGFRAGWMVLSGAKGKAKDYIEGLEILSNMRLCSNVPAQQAVQTALGGFGSDPTDASRATVSVHSVSANPLDAIDLTSPTSWMDHKFTVGGDLGRGESMQFYAKNDSTWWDKRHQAELQRAVELRPLRRHGDRQHHGISGLHGPDAGHRAPGQPAQARRLVRQRQLPQHQLHAPGRR